MCSWKVSWRLGCPGPPLGPALLPAWPPLPAGLPTCIVATLPVARNVLMGTASAAMPASWNTFNLQTTAGGGVEGGLLS